MPLERLKTVCKEVVVPDAQGRPVGGLSCKQIPIADKPPPGYSITKGAAIAADIAARIAAQQKKDEEKSMCCETPELVCASTAQAIRLENSSELLTFTFNGEASLSETLASLPLWRSMRLVYFAVSGGPAADALTLTLEVSGITQVGPLLGGELSGANGNACAIFNCARGRVAGPVEEATLTVASASGVAIAAGTVIIRIAYFYPGSAEFTRDMEACRGGDCPTGGCPVG